MSFLNVITPLIYSVSNFRYIELKLIQQSCYKSSLHDGYYVQFLSCFIDVLIQLYGHSERVI